MRNERIFHRMLFFLVFIRESCVMVFECSVQLLREGVLTKGASIRADSGAHAIWQQSFSIMGVREDNFLSESRSDYWSEASGGQYSHTYSTAIPLAALGATEPCHSSQIYKFTKQHATCAVVGSSSNLLDSLHGSAIDQAEAVFRINAAPSEGFEEDVGSRTSYRVGMDVSNGSAVSVRIDKSVAPTQGGPGLLLDLSLTDCPQPGCLIISSKSAEQLAGWFNHLLAAVGKRATDYGVNSNYAVEKWSNGLLAVATALALCEHVELYGFGLGLSQEGYAKWKRRNPKLDCPRSQVYGRYYSLESLGLRDYCLPEVNLNNSLWHTHNWRFELALLHGLDSASFLTWNRKSV